MKILIVDDEDAARYAMAKALRAEGREILEASNGEVALQSIREQQPDLVFLDLNMPVRDGLSVLSELQGDAAVAQLEIIVVTANESVAQAIECIRRGATDFLTKPYDLEHVRSLTRRSEERVRLQHQVAQLQLQADLPCRFGRLLGISSPMKRLYGQIEKAARSSLPVLIRGESGTGKELVARELHQRSNRSQKSMVAVNTAAIAESLIESELFGHVKGAFTGADRPREGVFRQADGGTLFLDEIGDMPIAVQTRLLRVLQESILQPVGSEQNIAVDVRVISATHQDLEQAITDKAFRQDLYFRLKGIELVIPPLRSRREDILLLASEFVGEERQFSNDAIAALLEHSWPGNVRELKQRVLSAVAMSETASINRSDLGFATTVSLAADPTFERYFELPLAEAHQLILEEFDRTAIHRVLEMEAGNITAAARRLGMHRQSLQQKMKQLGIR
ncbi:MAG: sigma-54 dependent transcriptional regulator [Pirellula sp.]|nr:sigma-54 dependent transcriptional regulator [Pirellula sp.]